MKLSHLSLAIFSAIALAACGGSSSGSDHTTPDQGHSTDQNQGGNTDQNTDQNNNKEEEVKKDADIVDPTKDNVVDAINLAKTSTTASQQYIRGATSVHDRIVNPSNATPASATALSGITLDVQNPNLTNIVIGRIEGTNAKGEEVKIAQYLGSLNTALPSTSGDQLALQALNRPNALVQNSYGDIYNWELGSRYLSGSDDTLILNPLFNTTNFDLFSQFEALFGNSSKNITGAFKTYNDALEAYNEHAKKNAGKNITGSAEFTALDKAITALEAAIKGYNDEVDKVAPDLQALNITSSNPFLDNIVDSAKLAVSAKNAQEIPETDYKEVSFKGGPDTKKLARYGFGLYPYAIRYGANTNAATINPLHNSSDRGWGDTVNPLTGDVTGASADGGATPAGDATHGLVGIYNQPLSNGSTAVVVRGDEDNNIRTTRIFGHLYRDPADFRSATELSNSWERPATFITEIDGTTRQPTAYGFGAKPMTLDHVQYGRVTAEIGDTDLANYAGTNDWYKVQQRSVERDPAKVGDADDFYFYRGTGATTVEQMAAIQPDTKINYRGHALMYGIDNKFHGGGQELPNAFGSPNSYGLGNFVEATLDMGAKKFSGSVFNAWHSPEQKAGKIDTLVTFSGDVTGNTVIGHAERAYMNETNPADLRASFYGAQASEVGGAINSVVRQDPFGPIGWGGVFGAKRVASGGNKWLVSSEDK